MADKSFVVKNGFVVNNNLIFANNGQVGLLTNAPDANVSIAGNANVVGNVVITQMASVGNNLTVTSNAAIGKHLTVGNNATISGNLSVALNANVGGNANVAGTMEVVGNTSLLSRLTVGNTAMFQGPVTINADATFVRNFNTYMNSPVTLSNTSSLTVNAVSNFYNAAAVYSTLLVSGDTTLQNRLFVTNTALLSNNMTVTGNVTMSNTLAVQGAGSFNNTMIVSGATTLSSTLNVTGVGTFNSNVNVTGALSVSGNATVAGDGSFLSNLSVSNSVTISRNLSVSSNTTMSGFANVVGSTQLNNTLLVNGPTTINSTATLRGAVTSNGAVTVANTLTVTGAASLSTLNVGVVQVTSNLTHGVVSGNVVFNNQIVAAGNLQFTSGILANNSTGALYQVLQSNGAGGVFWGSANLSAVSAPGSPGEVLFNRNGSMGSCSAFTFTETSNTVGVAALNVTTNTVTIGTSQYFISNGNVGFGTNAPSNKLSVFSSANNYDGVIYRNTSVGSAASAGFTAATVGANGVSVFQTYTDKAAYLSQADAAPLYLRTSALTRMTLDASGNVGVGVTPNTLFHVGGASRFDGSITVNGLNGSGGGIVLSDDGDIVDLNNGYCNFRFTAGVQVYTANKGGTAAITFANNGSGTFTGGITATSGAFSGALTQGGNQVLHAGNYTTYTVTKTGTGASGTWGISISGSAATVSSITSGQVTTALGYTPLNPGLPISLSQSAPATSAAYFSTTAYGTAQGDNRTHFGFNTGTSYVNYIRGSATYHDSQNFFVGGEQVLTAGNYNTYAPTLTGTGASGTWGIGISGTAALATKASTLSQGGGTGTAMTFTWSGQTGQPAWLWGSNDGTSHFVWNPSNFNVNSAVSATSSNTAVTANSINNGDIYTSGNQINSGRSTANNTWELALNYSGFSAGNTYLRDTTVFNGRNVIMARFQASDTTLYCWGNIVAYTGSDIRLKTNIENIKNPIDKIKRINGVEFDWTDDYLEKSIKDDYFTRKHDVGVIAQEIEEVLPEVVSTRRDGIKAVKYDRIVPLLIEAIKEQQKQIEELKSIVNRGK